MEWLDKAFFANTKALKKKKEKNRILNFIPSSFKRLRQTNGLVVKLNPPHSREFACKRTDAQTVWHKKEWVGKSVLTRKVLLL